MCDRISNQFYGRWLQFNVDTNWNGIIVIEVISGGVVAPDHDLLLTYCSAPTPTYEFYDRWESAQLLNFWKSLLLRLKCGSVAFQSLKATSMAQKWDVYQVICNLATWSNGTRLPVDRRALQVALLPPELLMTWTTPTKSPYYLHCHRIARVITLTTLFWPTRTPVRAPEHNTMTKWLLPLPPNTHITCTAAAIADPINILLLWNCKRTLKFVAQKTIPITAILDLCPKKRYNRDFHSVTPALSSNQNAF